MSNLIRDAAYALRTLRRTPGFTAVAVLTIAVGIGANTAIFSVVNGVLLRPLPYESPGQLVTVWQTNLDWMDSEVAVLRSFSTRFPASHPILEEWRRQRQVFDSVAGHYQRPFIVRDADGNRRIWGVAASAGLFRVLGVEPAVGRGFLPEEGRIGSEPVAVLAHGFWQARYGGDGAVVGRTLSLSGVVHTIVGVMPDGFWFPAEGLDVWVLLDDEDRRRGWDDQFMSVVGRLQPGMTVERAQAEMEGVTRRIEEANPEGPNVGVRVVSHLEEVVGDTRWTLVLVLAAVGLVLAVAATNVANLCLVRATARRREIAVRAALGAGGRGIARQLMVESLLLALAGAAVGLVLAASLLDPLLSLAPVDLPRAGEVGIDTTVLLFTFGVALVASVVFGLAPALHARRLPIASLLQESSNAGLGGARGAGGRQLLVAGEVAVAVVLTVAGALLINSYVRLRAVDPGFVEKNLLTAFVTLPDSAGEAPERRVELVQRLLETIRALPGVAGRAAVEPLPFSGSQSSSGFEIVGRALPEGTGLNAMVSAVSPGYFETMGIPVVRGRAFTDRDVAGTPPVMIINREMARRFWPDEDPVGAQVLDEGLSFTVVGVVGDVKHGRLDEPTQAKRYTAMAQTPPRELFVVLKTGDDPLLLAGALRRAVNAVPDDAVVERLASMEQLLSRSVADPRFRALLVALLAGIGVALALVGLYGVIAYTVAERRREIGLRMALGARRSDVVRELLAESLRVAGSGVLVGLLGALALGRALAASLYEIGPTDPATYGGVAVAVTAIALAASLVPARRAARVDPVVALYSG